jgi:hypothetical protein
MTSDILVWVFANVLLTRMNVANAHPVTLPPIQYTPTLRAHPEPTLRYV